MSSDYPVVGEVPADSYVQQAALSPDHQLGAIIPTPRGRKIAYAVYAGVALVVGNTAVGIAAAGIDQPVWLIVASAIVANLAAPFSALAIANAKACPVAFETKAFGAQDALTQALQGAAGLAGWTVDFGIPSRRDELHIWVDEGIDDWNQGTPTTGLVTAEETFRLTVYVYARRTGADAREIRDDIKAAADVVSSVIGSAPFLGGAVFYASIVSAQYDSAFADPEGRAREGVMALTVQCSAYLA